MSSARLRKKLRGLIERERALVEELAACPAMLRGSFTRIHTRCGKPNCWCAHAPRGHTHTRLTWNERGHTFTRKVPAEEVERVIQWTANYRSYRARRKRLVALHEQIAQTLDQLEQHITERTRQPLPYLQVDDNSPKSEASSNEKH